MPFRSFRLDALTVASALVLLLAIGSGAEAATDGTVGATSQGSVVVSLEIPGLVRISDLDDIDLGVFSGAGGMLGRDNVCVWSTTRAYQITATGSGAAAAFALTGGTLAAELPYTVQWADTQNAFIGAGLTTGTPFAGQGAATTSPTCLGGSALNASLIIAVSAADLTAAPADVYTGTLTLLVEPE